MKVIVIKDSVIHGQRIYKTGEAFELDNAVAQSLIERGYVTPEIHQPEDLPSNSDEEPIGGIEYSREELAKFDRKELQRLAKNLGVKASGTNEEIIERVAELHAVEETADDEELGEDELPNTSMPE